jgi:hypothetical protein
MKGKNYKTDLIITDGPINVILVSFLKSAQNNFGLDMERYLNNGLLGDLDLQRTNCR